MKLMACADSLGFHRYWVGEHHLPGYASASPEVLIAAGLQHTRSIRLGSGALLLGYRDMLRVAMDFRTLSALGNRVDLGIGRGRADRHANHLLLVANRPSWGEDGLFPDEAYGAEARQLVTLLGGAAAGVSCMPEDAPQPQLWVCGGERSATLAAELGAAFCYTLFHPGKKSASVLHRYRTEFDALHPGMTPCASIAVAGSVVSSDRDAEQVRKAHRYLAYWPDIVAPADEAADQLQALCALHGPDEVLWLDIAVSTGLRLASMERLSYVVQI
jgi:luciferase family oxidoreductase group 1